MAGQEGKIEARCPACDAKYRVPSSSVGHRARCAKCHATFRVSEPDRRSHTSRQPYPPTEEDILAWLNEGADEEFIAPRPRVFGEQMPESDPRTENAPQSTPGDPENVRMESAPPAGAGAALDRDDDMVDAIEPPVSRLRKTG